MSELIGRSWERGEWADKVPSLAVHASALHADTTRLRASSSACNPRRSTVTA